MSPAISRLGLIVHPDRPRARELGAIVTNWWTERGVAVVVDATEGGPDPKLAAEGLDVIISLGGDGTMLRSVALAAPRNIPVLGVNLGNLGYLTTVEPEELGEACELLRSGDFLLDRRMLLEITLERAGGARESFLAMNEVVVEKTSDGHTIFLGVTIGKDQFLTYAADGIMVATPTGSTAYNLSLRGPIVSPRLRALVMTPIAPHMLFDRTLVIEPELAIRLEVLRDRETVVIVDGERVAHLTPGDAITVRESPFDASMVRFGERGFYEILHQKFGLLDR